MYDILDVAEECWMTVKVDLPVLGLIPFCVQKQVLIEEQPFNFPGIVFFPVWYGLYDMLIDDRNLVKTMTHESVVV